MSINTTHDLLAADYSEIEHAEIKLKKGDPAQYVNGRIVGRFQSDLQVRREGNVRDVPTVENWELVRYQPVTSEMERKLITSEWKPVEDTNA